MEEMIEEMNGKEAMNEVAEQVQQLVIERGQGTSPTFEIIERGQRTKSMNEVEEEDADVDGHGGKL